jgi:hypothetical protein
MPKKEYPDYRSLILTDAEEAQKQLRDLARLDYATFVAYCHRMLTDEDWQVRDVAFIVFGQRGKEPDPFIEAKALQDLAIPDLHAAAAFVLEMVGSSAPTTVQTLFTCAENGSYQALAALQRRVESQQDRERLLELARRHILSPIYYLREQALFVLTRLSTASKEEEWLLQAARLYYDELVIDALGNASPRVLPALEQLLSTVPSDCVEYRDLYDAVSRIKARMATSEQEAAALDETTTGEALKATQEM